jgi:hypothetical protein
VPGVCRLVRSRVVAWAPSLELCGSHYVGSFPAGDANTRISLQLPKENARGLSWQPLGAVKRKGGDKGMPKHGTDLGKKVGKRPTVWLHTPPPSNTAYAYTMQRTRARVPAPPRAGHRPDGPAAAAGCARPAPSAFPFVFEGPRRPPRPAGPIGEAPAGRGGRPHIAKVLPGWPRPSRLVASQM